MIRRYGGVAITEIQAAFPHISQYHQTSMGCNLLQGPNSRQDGRLKYHTSGIPETRAARHFEAGFVNGEVANSNGRALRRPRYTLCGRPKVMNNAGELRPYTRRVLLTTAVVAGVVVVIAATTWLIQGLLVVFAGILFGLFLNHLSRHLAHVLNVRYGAGLAIVVISLLMLVGGVGYFMGSRISQQVSEFSAEFIDAGERMWNRFEQSRLRAWIDGVSAEGNTGLLPSSVKVVTKARSAIAITLSAIGGLVLAVFLGFYFALQPEIYRDGLVRLLPPHTRPRLNRVLQTISKKLWRWMLGRLAAMALIGVGSTIGLWIIGIPLPVTQGVLAALLCFVPNLGPLLASVPPILIGLQQGGNAALYVAGYYLALQFVESYFITPLIDQQQVSLPPAMILTVQLLMGMTAGFLGLLLATPLAVVAFILVRELYVKDALEDR